MQLMRQDEPDVIDLVTALVAHLVDEAALRGRLWIVEETRVRVRGLGGRNASGMASGSRPYHGTFGPRVKARPPPEAEEEVGDAAEWYEARHVGLGVRFVVAVDAALDRIADNSSASEIGMDLRCFGGRATSPRRGSAVWCRASGKRWYVRARIEGGPRHHE